MSTSGEIAQAWGEITAYEPSMAPRVAEMFNAFNESWPGGFEGGFPFDEQRVRDRLDTTSAIADLIALDADGEPVGYCGLYPHWRDANAAYVSILGVVPRVMGKKYGKRLLLRAIELATEQGISRVDLHTWSGNLNAVPLYKKVGMFWVPETSVYMQDYIPGFLQMPLAKEWFRRHPDWYGCFQRELAQAPDKHVVGGMALYEYVFEVGHDRLVGEVDRYGWGFCGVERTLDGERVAVRTRLRSHDILMGVPNEMTVHVENETSRDLPVTLSVEPFEGLAWSEPFPVSLPAPAGECVRVTREFVVDRTAETYKHEASEAIKSRVVLGAQVVDLIAGGKIQPAVELTSAGAYHIAPIGKATTVCLDLTNHSKQPQVGRVNLRVEELPGSQQAMDFALGAEEISGVEIPLSLPGDLTSHTVTLQATPSVKAGGIDAAMPTFRLPIVADVPDLQVVVRKGDEEWVHLLTDQLDVAVQLEGGRVRLYRRSVPGMVRHVGFEIGPPFGLSLDRTLAYAYETVRDGAYLTLVLEATSLQVPDLEIRKYVRVSPGVREVEHWTTLTSRRASGAVAAGGRATIGGGGNLLSTPFGSVSRAFTPVGGRVIECDPTLTLVSDQFVPQEPEQWPETWTAAENLAYGDLAAWFWKPDRVNKVKVSRGSLSSLESESVMLGPGQTVEVYHLWYGFSFQSLPDVRNRWSQLVGHVEIPRAERYGDIETVPPFWFRLAGEQVIGAGTTRRTVEALFATLGPLPGELRLGLPCGWRGAFVTPGGLAETIPMPQPALGDPIPIEVELTVPEGTGCASGTVNLHLGGEFELDFGLPLLLTGGGAVDLDREEVEGQKVIKVSNGALSFWVGGLGGNLIRLQDAKGRTFLADNFPEVKPWFFVDHHIGGIEPVILVPGTDLPFVEPALVALDVVEDGTWRGARASWTMENLEALRGQVFDVTYLVLPGCPVMRVRVGHHNPTPRRVSWMGLFLAQVTLQGDLADLTLYAPGGVRPWLRTRPRETFINQPNIHEPWAWVGRGDQSLTLFSPDGFPGTVVIADLRVMFGGLMAAEMETAPRGRSSVEFALALNQPRDKTAELIGALARRGEQH